MSISLSPDRKKKKKKEVSSVLREVQHWDRFCDFSVLRVHRKSTLLKCFETAGGEGGGGGAKPGSHVLLGFWLWHSSDIIETQKHSVPSLGRSYKAVQCRQAAPSSLPPARKWKTPDTWELLVHDLNAIRGCSYTFPITAAECATHEEHLRRVCFRKRCWSPQALCSQALPREASSRGEVKQTDLSYRAIIL